MDESRLKLKIGSPVIAKDGNCVHIQQLAIDSQRKKVVGLILKRDFLSKHTVTAPIEMVDYSTESEVYLGIDCKEVFPLPRYVEGSPLLLQDQRYLIEKDAFVTRNSAGIGVLSTPGTDEHGMLKNQLFQETQIPLALSIRAGQHVLCKEGHIGRVKFLLFDPSGKIKGFVMLAKGRQRRDYIVPIDWVQQVDLDHLDLSISQEAMERLDEYVPDVVLKEKFDHSRASKL